MPKIIAVIPAYNEEKMIGEVVRETKKYVSEVIVVDDASEDSTAQIAKAEGAQVYQHIINRGVGGALGTGFKAALQKQADIIVMLDADGQHDPASIPALISPIQKNMADATLGSRFLKNQKIPYLRKIYNKLGNFATRLLFGVKTTDSQSGMRAFSRQALGLIDLKTNRMEVCSELIKEIGQKKIKMIEVPIKAIYTEYSLSKGQNLLNGFKTFVKLIFLKTMK